MLPAPVRGQPDRLTLIEAKTGPRYVLLAELDDATLNQAAERVAAAVELKSSGTVAA